MNNFKIISKRAANKMGEEKEVFCLDQYSLVFQKPKRLKSPIAWVEHIPFAFFIMEILRPELFVELGVHTGNSYSAFCQAVSTLNIGTSCYGVDTWKGDEHAEFYDDSIFNELNEYNNNNYSAFSSLIRGTFNDALKYFSDKSIDLLHIDGFHTYEAVKEDFNTWLPKMSDHGVILLHDTCVRANNFGVWKLFEELKVKYRTFEFIHGHGLGIVIVGDQVNENFSKFLDQSDENDFYLTFFAKLGEKISDEFRLSSLDSVFANAEKLPHLEKELSSLQNLIEEKEQKNTFEKRDLLKQIDSLENKLSEMDLKQTEQDYLHFSHRNELEIIKNSLSWRISNALSRLVRKLKIF